MHVLPRMRASPLFLTFALYALCPRFDSFDSFAMERENAAPRQEGGREAGGRREGERIPLANDVKVRSRADPVASGGHRNFSLSPPTAQPGRPRPPLALRCVHKQKLHARILYIPRWSVVRFPVVYRLNVVINCKANGETAHAGGKFFKLPFFFSLSLFSLFLAGANLLFLRGKIDKYFFSGEGGRVSSIGKIIRARNKDLTV